MAKKQNRKAALPALAAVAAMILLVLVLPRGGEETPPSTEPSRQETAATVPESRFTAEDFALDGDYLLCSGAQSMAGIDVSVYQGQIDWAAVKESGIRFAIVRLGYRGIKTGQLNTDERAAENLAGARAAGLLVGAYFYSQATTPEEAEAEAEYALQILGDFRLDLPLAFDWEIESRTEAVDAATATDCALAFCSAVEQSGQKAMIYFNSYQAKERLQLELLTDYPWWLAMYSLDKSFPCRFDLWQYTCTGSVPGIRGDVDINVMLLE